MGAYRNANAPLFVVPEAARTDPYQLVQVRPAVQKLLTVMESADNGNNPYQRAAMAVPPTVAVSASTDATLATSVPLNTSNALTSAALNKIAWYGGVPKPYGTGTTYVCMPVTSVLPATSGNLAAGANAFGVTNDMNALANAIETCTDSDVIEFCVFTSNTKQCFIQVDGQYVDFTGVTGPGASADTFIKLTFASRKARRIRLSMCSIDSNGNTQMMKAIRIKATCDFWKPDQSAVIKVGWPTDSYGEGKNSEVTVMNISNGCWPVLASELLGFRDCRQLAVGTTGYLAAGTRSKLRDQIPNWSGQGQFDLLVVGHGYNDTASSAAAVTAEALLAYRALRSAYPLTPIVVLGPQAADSGPSATILALETAISSAVTTFNDPLCKFAAVSAAVPAWLNGTGRIGATNASGNSDVYVSNDGDHPSLAGHEHLAFLSAKAIRTAVMSMAA